MSPKPLIIKRVFISLVIGVLLGAILSEVSFYYSRETAREPRSIVITIPLGTAERVSLGEKTPSLPTDMIFVVGDLLVINNNDSVNHKLGPLWIPANSSAQLFLGEEENIAYECSFQPGNYFGLDVRQALTLKTRIYGILFAGLPMSVLIALYSFVIPAKKKDHVSI